MHEDFFDAPGDKSASTSNNSNGAPHDDKCAAPTVDAMLEMEAGCGKVRFSHDAKDKDDEVSSSGEASSQKTSLVSDERRANFRQRASQIILEVPVAQLRRFKQAESVGSLHQEAKHFSDITTLHGPKRIFYGKRWSTWFWIATTLIAVVFLFCQISSLLAIYASRPTVSQVSFMISEDGLDFPLVTVCNFNPIKQNYIQRINETGDFSEVLLSYLLQSNADTETLFGTDRADLHIGEGELQLYKKNHTDFTIPDFFMDAGFECSELMMLCSFGSRRFDCCKYAKPVLTNFGKCYTLDVRGSDKEWMHKQVSAGANAGLQLVLNPQLGQQSQSVEGAEELNSGNSHESGFRYYVHSEGSIPYLASEGISVSPSNRVYSAISSNRYLLLPHSQWGNCTAEWPTGYETSLPYSSANCAHLCKARFFDDNCGCSPADYNLERVYNVCTPYQTFQCIDKHIRKQINGSDYYQMPTCTECKVECNNLVYHAYNSYGHSSPATAFRFVDDSDHVWTSIRENGSTFVTINVFFRDMSHTEYKQVQATSLTEILSDMGGNMGLFLGMSVFSFAELVLFLSKVSWIAVSKKRRDYMFKKKKSEEEKEKQLEEAVTSYKQLRSRKANGSLRALRSRVVALANACRTAPESGTTTRKPSGRQVAIDDAIGKRRAKFMGKIGRSMTIAESDAAHYYRNNWHRPRDSASNSSVIELSINLDDLKEHLDMGNAPALQSGRGRSGTAPPTDSIFFVENET